MEIPMNILRSVDLIEIIIENIENTSNDQIID